MELLNPNLKQMIKCISILQPWASLVVARHKRIETRSWNTKYRGELYIHASKKWTQQLYDTIIDIGADKHFAESGFVLPFGAIIGKVDLVETFPTELLVSDGKPIETFIEGLEITPQEIAFGDYSPNRFGWILENPVVFVKPIPAKGQLGIWNFDEKLIIS